MGMRDWAVAYARAGYRVIPCYTVNIDENGIVTCACDRQDLHASGKLRSKGKHPIVSLMPQGAISATSDLDVIATWPEDGYNIGVAFSDSFVCLDIDHVPTIQKLLAPEFGLRDRTVAVKSGRPGVHIYLTCAPTGSKALRDTDGNVLGSIRGHNEYAIVPPSLHETGRRYEWIGPSLLEFGALKTQDDGYSYAESLLSLIGIQLRPRVETTTAPLEGAIEECDLPFVPNPIMELTLNSLLTGTYPTEDRSGTLYKLACEIWRAVLNRGITIDRNVVAGVVKKTDFICYKKFTDRFDRDKYYWDAVVRAEQDVYVSKKDAPKEPPKQQADTGPNDGINLDEDPLVQEIDPDDVRDRMEPYYYSDTDGFIDRTQKTPRRLANFEPKILERVIAWTGSEEAGQLEDWVVQLKQGEEAYDLRLKAEQYANYRTLAETVDSATPSHFVIEDRMAGPFKAAMQHYSGRRPRRHAYAAPGWLPDRDGFLVPGVPGAIMANGRDPSIVFEVGDAPKEMAYTRTIAEDANLAQVVELLFTSIPPRVMIPLATQVLASPLASLGFKYQTVMHLYGPTNTYKTTIARAIISLYGYQPSGEAMGIDHWGSTTNSIRAGLFFFRDLPFLVDDFKVGIKSEKEVTEIIQAYGDSSGRGRLNRNMRRTVTQIPRGLILTTGEDVWESQRSVLTRSMLVRVERGAVSLDRLSPLSLAAERGQLGALGLAWIRWLCSQGKESLHNTLLKGHDSVRPQVQEWVGEEHPRLVSSVTSLAVVNRIFQVFLKTIAPSFVEEYRRLFEEGWTSVLKSVTKQAESGTEISPLMQVITAISESLGVNQVRLKGKLKTDTGVGPTGIRAVGYIDSEYIYLTKWLTFGWFTEVSERSRSAVGFGWSQVVNEALETIEETSNNTEYVWEDDQSNPGSRSRLLKIPRRLIVPELEPTPVLDI